MTDKTQQQTKHNPDGSKTVTLKYPVRLATGELLEKVTVRRARIGDLRAVAHVKHEVEQGLMLLQRVTGLMEEDLDMLDIADLEVLQSAFQS